MKNFTELNLNPSLMQSIARMHFKIPTPIQAQAIPPALIGKDVLGTAQTGTGKTLCYGIACINKLLNDRGSNALIICPTRELAVQVEDVLNGLIENTMNIKSAVLIGGESMQKQLRQLQKRPRLIIGTPGRLNDHLKRKSLKLHQSYFLVLDETDRMLDMGFTPQIEQILKFIPKKHQTLLFSATLPQNILKITERYLNDPIRIRVGSTTTPISKIKQEVIQVSEGDKYKKLLEELYKRKGSILIFVKTKRNADKMADRLHDDGHHCDCMHGNLRQSKRQRTLITFRSGKIRILISTELAARGLDIPSIQHVINYHLPQVPEDFIHRIGRTARAGAEGCALTFITPNDKQMWDGIQRLINPNFKAEFKNSNKRFNKNKRGKQPFNKKRKFKDKKKFFNKERNHSEHSRDLNGKSFNFKKGKKRFLKKKDFRFEGYTNNPKFFDKQKENTETDNNERKKFNFKKGKKKFKNRNRPKSFKFKKHNR
ncbi:MAG: DEAD/DEAH box helicase, partial [Pelagibacteraceae bacterium]|nr:DEAD/DEAH box helicase [Pelagibacteraceae bacterium]